MLEFTVSVEVGDCGVPERAKTQSDQDGRDDPDGCWTRVSQRRTRIRGHSYLDSLEFGTAFDR